MQVYSPLKVATGIFAVLATATALYGYLQGEYELVFGIIAGHFLAYLNIMSGFVTIRRFFRAENKLFFKGVFGGMLLRMAITLLAVVIFLAVTEIHKFSFTVSLVISYILYSVIEIRIIYKNLETHIDNS